MLLPSPWMVAIIVKQVPKVPGKTEAVNLVRIAGMSDAGLQLEELRAKVEYIGEDKITVQQVVYNASVYELRSVSFPAITLWLGAGGIPLQMQDSGKPEQRIELLQLKKFGHDVH